MFYSRNENTFLHGIRAMNMLKFRWSVCNKNRGNQIPPTTIFPTIFFLKSIPTITDIHADQKTRHPYVKNLSLQIYQQSHQFSERVFLKNQEHQISQFSVRKL